MVIKKEYPVVMCHWDTCSKVLFAEFKSNLKVDIDIAKAMVSHRMEVTNNETHYVIIDFSNVREVTSEAKEFLQRSDAGLKNILGAGFLAKNPVAVLIANIFIKSTKAFPTKFFANKADAYIWVENLSKVVLKKI